ncbi:MAG: ATP-binding protein [Clostridium sp.]|nr:ATP-binding protein [Bacteroides sp.]MCM1197855.1 ATP-binding protein [Clostridium sp.]
MIQRALRQVIENKIFKGKAVVLIGARQAGKSTLFRQITESREEACLSLNCDEPEVRDVLTKTNTAELKQLIGHNRIVVIDEAQRVPDIGLTMKLITDNFPDVQLLATGSSAFELQNSLNETLTGRKYEYHLFPLSTRELMGDKGALFVRQHFELRLIYGSYPDVLTHSDEAKELLMNLAESYLYKDLLTLDSIRKPAMLEKLLIALSLQLGSEISYNELAQTIGSDNKTIEKYIDLLEKCFIIFRLDAFSRNLRNELKKSKKIYFYDNGIRNAVIQNFAPPSLRQDMGALWENFVISERKKANMYSGRFAKPYFWRTVGGQEIDYIEEEDGEFTALEMKWNPKKGRASLPDAFLKSYKLKDSAVVTPENYIEWV